MSGNAQCALSITLQYNLTANKAILTLVFKIDINITTIRLDRI